MARGWPNGLDSRVTRNQSIGCRVLKVDRPPEKWAHRAYLGTTGPSNSLIQTTVSLPLQSGEKAISTSEVVAERNGPSFAKKALSALKRSGRSSRARKSLPKMSKRKAQRGE